MKFGYYKNYFGSYNRITAITGLSLIGGISEGMSQNTSLGITIDTNNAQNGDWEVCGTGMYICGIRTKLNYDGEMTGVEFRCCMRNQFSRRRSQNNGKRNICVTK